MAARLAVDIGGTFTDVVFTNPAGITQTLKVSTTPDDITIGILEGVARSGLDPSDLDGFLHGTTVALNALLERKLPSIALITTAGFRDVLEIMRTSRPQMYDLMQEKPQPLVRRRDRHEISARMTSDGTELRPVDPDEVRAIAATLREQRVKAVGVCLLHSYADERHEREVQRILEDELPDAEVSTSSSISRVWREFERTSTTVANVAVKPIVVRYMHTLEGKLRERGLTSTVRIMQSNGGAMSAAEACERPVATLMSGPVGGVTAAIDVTRKLPDCRGVMTFDLGGTSADVAIIDQGAAVVRDIGHIDRWPIMVPMVDIESIGAGGGSIARVDEFGALTVGPDSAGAQPGPVCYHRGGEQPTVTDANLVLGRIDPSAFQAGSFGLDIEGARAAIQRRIAEPLGMSVEDAAEGIITVVNSNMSRMLWDVMGSRGFDPREFHLFAFGGAGPLHACQLAGSVGARGVIVPDEPGTFSASGILGADVRYDAERMLVGGVVDHAALSATLRDLERESRERVERDLGGEADVDFQATIEMRYVGQGDCIVVDLDRDAHDLVAAAEAGFRDRHDRLYGFVRDDIGVEAIKLQVAAMHRRGYDRTKPPAVDAPAATEPRAVSPLYADGRWQDGRFYARDAIVRDERIPGPSVIEESGCTTYIPPGWQAWLDQDGVLHAVAVSSED